MAEIHRQLLLFGSEELRRAAASIQDPNARRFRHLEYMEAIQGNFRVMDMTAFSLCMENHLPIVVFDVGVVGNIRRVIYGEEIGTLIN